MGKPLLLDMFCGAGGGRGTRLQPGEIAPNGYTTVAGHMANTDYCRFAMGIDWMTGRELSQAIPPAYTEWIGRQMIEILGFEVA